MALSDNHKRVLQTTLLFIEKETDTIIRTLKLPLSDSMRPINVDLSPEAQTQILENCINIKTEIERLRQKYELSPSAIPLSRLLYAKRSQLWEVLCDTNLKQLKKYGRFEKHVDTDDLQSDIDRLLNLTEKLDGME